MNLNNGEIKAADQVHSEAHEKAEAKIVEIKKSIPVLEMEAESKGILKKISYDTAQNKLLKFAILSRVKQEKEYQKQGMTWAEFCESVGENVRNVDRVLKDVEAVYKVCSDKLVNLIGVPFYKIRHLGKSISDKEVKIDNGALVVGNVQIPLTPEHKDEIEALIDELKATHKKENAALSDKLAKEKKKRDRIVKAETETLHVEKDSLVEEVKRLSAFEPSKKEDEWFVEKMDSIIKLARRFILECQAFQADERVIDNDGLHNQITSLMQQGRDAFEKMRGDYGCLFVPDLDED